MEEKIVDWFETLSFTQVIVFILVAFLLNLMYKIVSGLSTKYSRINDHKEMKRAELLSYVDSTLTEIEDEIFSYSEKILVETDIKCTNYICGMNPKESQIGSFSLVLERALFLIIRSKIKVFMKQNHFHDKTGDKLEDYITTRAKECKVLFKKTISSKMSLYRGLRGHVEECFTESNAEAMMRKIVSKAKDIKIEEDEGIKKINDDYSIIKKTLKFFKNKKLTDLYK